jgi:hypothetical protein
MTVDYTLNLSKYSDHLVLLFRLVRVFLSNIFQVGDGSWTTSTSPRYVTARQDCKAPLKIISLITFLFYLLRLTLYSDRNP